MGRVVPGVTTKSEVEQWNGSSWTEVNDVNTARYSAYASKFTYDDAYVAGGANPSVQTNTELWNGVSWVETSDMNTARQSGGSAGTQSGGGLAFGGNTGSDTAISEEWSSSSITTKVLTD